MFRNHRRESGVILLIVIATIMVMSVFAISILSQSLNQSASAQAQVDNIVAEELAKGAFWKVYADKNGGVVNPTVSSEPSLNGKVFTVSITNSSTQYNSQVSY